MRYKEVLSSKSVGRGYITSGVAMFTFFNLVFLYIMKRNGQYELIFQSAEISKEVIVAIAIFAFFEIFIMWFCGILIFQGTREWLLDSNWVALVEGGKLQLKSPNEEWQSSIEIDVENIAFMEKTIQNQGDSRDLTIWTFFLKDKTQISLKCFGELDLDRLVNHLASTHSIEFKSRNLDFQGNEI